MRPQRKPFVVEIRKTKQFYRKSVSAEANRPGATMQTGAKPTIGLAIRSEERA